MPNGLEPTETYDEAITVELATDSGERDQIRCGSYAEAISVVKDHQNDVTASAIVSRDGEVVFDSADMDIDEKAMENKPLVAGSVTTALLILVGLLVTLGGV